MRHFAVCLLAVCIANTLAAGQSGQEPPRGPPQGLPPQAQGGNAPGRSSSLVGGKPEPSFAQNGPPQGVPQGPRPQGLPPQTNQKPTSLLGPQRASLEGPKKAACGPGGSTTTTTTARTTAASG